MNAYFYRKPNGACHHVYAIKMRTVIKVDHARGYIASTCTGCVWLIGQLRRTHTEYYMTCMLSLLYYKVPNNILLVVKVKLIILYNVRMLTNCRIIYGID